MGYFTYTNMINKPAKFRDKIPIIDLFLLLIVFISSLIIMLVISRVTGIDKIYTMSFTIVIIGIAYRILSVTSKKPHPSYLMSYIALHFLQPKRVLFAERHLAPFDQNRKQKFLSDVRQIQGAAKPSGKPNK
jgi:hypothetical protein